MLYIQSFKKYVLLNIIEKMITHMILKKNILFNLSFSQINSQKRGTASHLIFYF